MAGQRTIVVFGATGVQGTALIEALSPHAEYKIIALSRTPSSGSAKHLASLPNVSVVQAPASVMEKPLDALSSLGLEKGQIYGVFSVQGYVDPVAMVRQGNAIADAAVEYGVEHLVYSSVDFGGMDDDVFPSFEDKREVEKHIQTLPIGHTFLRPVQFMDLWLPTTEFKFKIGRTVTMNYTYYLHPDRKHQLVSSKDIGKAGALAFINGPQWLNGVVRLAGDELSTKELNATYREVHGTDVPLAPSLLAWGVKQIIPLLKNFAKFYDEHGFNVPIAAVREEIPDMEDYKTFLKRHKAEEEAKGRA